VNVAYLASTAAK